MRTHRILKNAFALALVSGMSFAIPSFAGENSDNKFTGYLFAYFEGGGDKNLQEHLRFAVSRDAKNWYALNGNCPVINSDTISTSGGIRDPHILRGEDGEYYIVATDMNTAKYGWKDNPGIVMLKSKDLVNWTHSKIVLKTAYPKHFGDAYYVWAPQTIYDKKAKKYMIYFTLQRNDRKDMVTYYAYANKDFTGFEKEPKVLFHAKYSCLDNDILERDGVYHMFYKGNIKDANGKELKNGIQQATAKKLKGPWKEDFKFIDAYADTRTGVEGSGAFKLNDGSGYVLMYDLFGSGRYEYQTSKDLYTFSKKPQSFNKDFFPRHGTVCSVTEDELKRMQQKWGYVLNDSYTGVGNPILPAFHADPEVLYSNKTKRYYIYSTTDGKPGWGGWQYFAFSSKDLKTWHNEGRVLDAKNGQIAWANGNLWAPAAQEVKTKDGYKYFLYFSAQPKNGNRKQIGVAVSDNPTGPFKDLGHPLISKEPQGFHGQLIDVDVFVDPVSGKPYLYWGNSNLAGAELDSTMTAIKPETITLMTPKGGTLKDYAFREGVYVFFRNGTYYFMWSVDDTGSPNYHVAYGTAKSPLGPIEVAKDPVILKQDPQHEIYGTAHNSVVQVPGTDDWYIVYHRINKDYLHNQPGVHREVCIDRMYFNQDGTIKPVIPTE